MAEATASESIELSSLFPHLDKELQSLKERSKGLRLESARMLVVDDHEGNRKLLGAYLKELGHAVTLAGDGEEALDLIHSQDFDLIFLDVMMPKISGYRVLEDLKADPKLREIPVLMTSGVEDRDSAATCIETGADDYLLKPLNFSILKARVSSCLEKRRLRDLEKAYVNQIEITQRLSQRLLNNILPPVIVERLKNGEETIAELFPEVTILFADIVNFTRLCAGKHPTELVDLLNSIFSNFDRLAEQYGLEKIKTLGDAYMAVGGLLKSSTNSAEAVAEMAFQIQKEISKFEDSQGKPLKMRVGIDTGPVIAGIIGIKKFSYDLWGDTVNIASRMESEGIPGQIQVTAATYERLQDKYLFERRGMIEVKGKGKMTTYWLKGRKKGHPGGVPPEMEKG